MRYTITLLLILLRLTTLTAQQTRPPDGGGSNPNQAADDVTPLQRQAIISRLQSNERALRKDGLLAQANRTMATKFEWPLAQASGYNDPGFYSVTNFVDQNTAFPDKLLDYNCGNRTYDLAGGYNHRGTDIITWPFPWQKMQQNAVQILAAAPGTIIDKQDGEFDRNCAFCTTPCDLNGVYVMHADGSVAWYLHMKKNTVTTKAIGQTVSAGEFLGMVGSSGNSTTPHLHLEVYTNNTYTQLVDPYAGTCNTLNVESWWANQQPYYVSRLLKVMTHSSPPAMPGCEAGEVVNSKINFVSGNAVYVGGYYRDQRAGQQALHKVYLPDNTVYISWTQNFNVFYPVSWWYYFISIPNQPQTGMWRYEITYNGQPPVTTYFAVNTIGYSFIGNGDWNNTSNWAEQSKPPAVLSAGHEIVINPVQGGECVVKKAQATFSSGKVTVAPGKVLRVVE